MKLRSQVKAATSSGSFWASHRSGSDLRRSRRLNPALPPSSTLHLLPPEPAEPSSRHNSRKRKASSTSDSSPPSLVDVKRQRQEDGAFTPLPADGSAVVQMEVEQSDSGRGGEIGDGDKGSEPNNVVLEEAQKSPPHNSISDVSGQGGEIEDGIQSEKKGSESDDAILQESDNKALPEEKRISEIEKQIPEEERTFCLNRSPSYGSVSIGNDESEKNCEDGIVESAEHNKEFPSVMPISAEEPAERISEEEISSVAGKHKEGLPSPSISSVGPQLHFALDQRGYNGRMESRKPEVGVRDFAPGMIKGNGGQTWTFRRTEIVAGSRGAVGLSESKVPAVCLYESMSLGDD